MIKPGRLLTAMATPFGPALSKVDLEAAVRLAQLLLGAGSDGLVISGTTGESPTLAHHEKLSLLEKVIASVGGSRVIAGTGSNDTGASVALSREAANLGVAGLLVISPYYNKPDQEGLYRHFRTIAEATPLPIILYNHPGRTGVSIAARTLGRLVEDCPTIVGLKDSSASLDVVSEFMNTVGPEFLLYSGNDSLTLPIMSVGGYGAISVASHIAGPELRHMITLAAGGEFAEARAIHFRLWDLMNALFMTPSPAPLKAALSYYGCSVGGVRLPLVEMPPVERAKLEQILERTLGSADRRPELKEASAAVPS